MACTGAGVALSSPAGHVAPVRTAAGASPEGTLLNKHTHHDGRLKCAGDFGACAVLALCHASELWRCWRIFTTARCACAGMSRRLRAPISNLVGTRHGCGFDTASTSTNCTMARLQASLHSPVLTHIRTRDADWASMLTQLHPQMLEQSLNALFGCVWHRQPSTNRLQVVTRSRSSQLRVLRSCLVGPSGLSMRRSVYDTRQS